MYFLKNCEDDCDKSQLLASLWSMIQRKKYCERNLFLMTSGHLSVHCLYLHLFRFFLFYYVSAASLKPACFHILPLGIFSTSKFLVSGINVKFLSSWKWTLCFRVFFCIGLCVTQHKTMCLRKSKVKACVNNCITCVSVQYPLHCANILIAQFKTGTFLYKSVRGLCTNVVIVWGCNGHTVQPAWMLLDITLH